MQPVEALAATDDREAGTDPDAAAAAYWLRNPESPRETSAFADLITQWESEPEWTGPLDAPEDTECPDV